MSNIPSPSSRGQPERQGDPLAACLKGFNAWLIERGYARSTRRTKLRFITKLGSWLDVRDLELAALDEGHIASFLQEPGKNLPGAVATGRQLLSWLRANNAIDTDHPDPGRDNDPVVQVVSRYERFLFDDRGLSPVTIEHYLAVIHAFLVDRFPARAVELDSLTIEDINGFVRRYHQKVSLGRLKIVVSALRGFCRYLFQCGDIATDIAGAIAGIPNWRLSGLPRPLAPDQLEALLDSCDRSTGVGRRDHAILLLLAQLGLRACEVVRLTLDDVDWNRGLITVSGKGNRRDHLPLPDSVGEALAAWLMDGRPTTCATRRLFVGKIAPHHGFTSSTAIVGIVRRALARARVKPSGRGAAHLLRHYIDGWTMSGTTGPRAMLNRDCRSVGVHVDPPTRHSLGGPTGC